MEENGQGCINNNIQPKVASIFTKIDILHHHVWHTYRPGRTLSVVDVVQLGASYKQGGCDRRSFYNHSTKEQDVGRSLDALQNNEEQGG